MASKPIVSNPKSVPEEIIDLTNDTTVLGGAPSINVEDFKNAGFRRGYEVKGIEGVKTGWGNRIDFTLLGDDGYESKISSWNFHCQKRFKPMEILNTRIFLEPGNHEKKLLLSF